MLGNRSFEFVPLWGLAVFLVYAMRRVDCRRCGVTVEAVPWAAGKMQTTHALVWSLASWAKVLSWREVAKHCELHRVVAAQRVPYDEIRNQGDGAAP